MVHYTGWLLVIRWTNHSISGVGRHPRRSELAFVLTGCSSEQKLRCFAILRSWHCRKTRDLVQLYLEKLTAGCKSRFQSWRGAPLTKEAESSSSLYLLCPTQAQSQNKLPFTTLGWRSVGEIVVITGPLLETSCGYFYSQETLESLCLMDLYKEIKINRKKKNNKTTKAKNPCTISNAQKRRFLAKLVFL